MKVIDFFCGIGGFSLGFSRAGMEVIGACEIEPYARAVYAKHFAPAWFPADITKIKPDDIPAADLWCGGFPCQDVSLAGKRAGLAGSRSGLWGDWAKLLRAVEQKPQWVVIENVPGLFVGGGIERVLEDLSEAGCDAEWAVISAADLGAPHLRKRVWIVAYPNGTRREEHRRPITIHAQQPAAECGGAIPDTSSVRQTERRNAGLPSPTGHEGRGPNHRGGSTLDECRQWWETEPSLGRVVDGVPHRVDRLRCIGNAIVPQIAEWLGRRIMEAPT